MGINKKTILFIALAAFVAGIMFTGGCLVANDIAGNNKTGTDNAGAETSLSGELKSNSISEIADSAGKAVVKISTTKITRAPQPYSNDPFFRYFFGDQLPREKQEEQGIGSGFILSEDGLVVTNQHVVANTTDIKITVGNKKENQKEYPAKIIGANYDLDLALLKIEGGSKLPHLELGDSNNTGVGDWVVAIGNPFGFDHTVTAGVISAKERPITAENRHYENLLQTDAAINPGNSGGPLLNLEGKVIGINTAVAQAQGIGFAIPSNTVKNAMEDLQKQGEESHSWLGIQLRDLTPELARYLGLDTNKGTVVVGVIPESPADKAGLRQNDVILELNGKEVKDSKDLSNMIDNMEIGEKGELLVYRNGQLFKVTFRTGERPGWIN